MTNLQDLKDLFVSYKQVDPVVANEEIEEEIPNTNYFDDLIARARTVTSA